MMRLLGLFIFGLLWLIQPFSSIAQTNSKVVKTEEGKFIIHKVEKGQTLYAISKMYSVSVEDIIKANSNIDDFGIRINQTLRIPVSSINKKEAKKSSIALSDGFIYHEVLKKETLYALSRKYEISIEEIEKYNPQLKDGLQVGMVLKIPMIPDEEQTSIQEQFQQPVADSLILHEVLPKETLYSLSKQYGVSIDSIQIVNGGLSDGLKVGATIRIPVLTPDYKLRTEIDRSKEDTLVVKRRIILRNDTLRIAVFLPFCIEKKAETKEKIELQGLSRLTKMSIDFYRGFNAALDTLRLKGYNLDISYFDTHNDTVRCMELFADTDMTGYDLFIGPVLSSNFRCISLQAKALSIPIISPVRISSALLLNNPMVVKTYASSPGLVVNLAEFVASRYADSGIVVISGKHDKDGRYATIFQKHFGKIVGDSVEIRKMWTASVSNFEQYIQKGKHNYVILMSTDEGFVSSSLSSMYKLIDEDTRITVFGLDRWQHFKSLDLEYLNAMEVTYPVQKFASFSDTKLREFTKSYRSAYYTDPTTPSLTAFDIASYFVESFFISRGFWEKYISGYTHSGLYSRFRFVKIDLEGGYENRGGFIVTYKDYTLNLAD